MSRYFTKTLASLEPYTPGEQLKIADIVKLNANENPYPPAPGVAAAVAAAVPGLRLYSDLTNGDLNAAIARHWGVRPGEYPLRQRQRREPAAGPARVLRRKHAAGLCRCDLQFLHGAV